MTTEPTDPDLFLLALDLSDSEPDEAALPADTPSSTSNPTTEHRPTRAERSALSEEAFQSLKKTYLPKIENGEIHTHVLSLVTSPSSSPPPSSPPAEPTPLTKPEAQDLLHAAEELYFFKRYAEAVNFLQTVLNHTDSGDSVNNELGDKARKRVDGETRRLLGYYLERATARLGEGRRGGFGCT
ncbi:uncharacterized protein C8A04DRAFT_23793 [Dichotomopilus funicola]|uniref:Uncharacterized protein n=1 Tax=Dichotomopilus funicola TaxID=1934379 RepID=A0AAN6VBP9_9PEZI|nr:hypothetical protein C8A04DRAFT_23793 [Dichotomopilus funicola]